MTSHITVEQGIMPRTPENFVAENIFVLSLFWHLVCEFWLVCSYAFNCFILRCNL